MSKIDDIISKFCISITGARDGDVLTGTTTSTKNAVIKSHGFIRPSLREVNTLKEDPMLLNQFKTKLRSIEYFENIEDIITNKNAFFPVCFQTKLTTFFPYRTYHPFCS